MNSRKHRTEFGDFQTPDELALKICRRLVDIGVTPNIVIEPTCGVGAFVLAAAQSFPNASKILGFEVSEKHLESLKNKLPNVSSPHRIELESADFFNTDWSSTLNKTSGSILVIGNFPWVTNATQGTIGGVNLPKKSNFLKHNGFDAITGKANFDISEWMLLEVLNWFHGRSGDIAMLVKTAVARKILAHAQRRSLPIANSFMVSIDAKKEFGASVEACLLVIRLSSSLNDINYTYTVYENLDDTEGRQVGYYCGLTVGDLANFKTYSFLLGKSPQKWRSGVKHDASSVMEFTSTENGFRNGLNEIVNLEDSYLYPLLKGSDIGSNKPWRNKFMLITQHHVGESTESIRKLGPNTWNYLERHADLLDARGSSIYKKNPRFSIFGIGDYTFLPWKIAICSLYKTLKFRIVGPINGRPAVFDDTVYFISFETENEALEVLDKLNSKSAVSFLSSLVFWDEKRPIKTGILNVLDWSRLENHSSCLNTAQLD